MAQEPTPSIFQTKYVEFIEDLLLAVPEYTDAILAAKALDPEVRLNRFHEEVRVEPKETEDATKNPGVILPGVTLAYDVWESLSSHTKQAIWSHLQILSICCFMESANSDPEVMEESVKEAMNKMKDAFQGKEFQDVIKKFMTFFKDGDPKASDASAAEDSNDSKDSGFPDLKGMFENGFPKLPDRFLKGHLARLAQEIVKDITPEDLGISPDLIKECEKDPSRSFSILFSTFSENPSIIQKTIAKIGKRLQQKFQSGAINPKDIAAEAEELMKEFAGNSSFVDMMEGIKTAFGFEDMDVARKAGKEGTARLSIARDRLRKKLEKKKAALNANKK